MNKIKKQILVLFKSSYFPFLILTFLLLFFHACITIGYGDDAYFQSVLNENNMFKWLADRYNNWSSRLIIEFFLAVISGHHTVWRLLNVAITLIGTFSITKIFANKKSSAMNWLICALILYLPKNLHTSAGWIATTLNYAWVASLGLFAIIPIRKITINEKISWYEYILYFGAMIYATNQEQMCLILLIVYFSFMCYKFYSTKKLNWFLLTGFLINLSSLVFILTCPGNAKRNFSEINTWFPDYVNINFFRKLEMGYSSTLFEFIMNPNLIFFIFTVLLFICVVLKQKNIIYHFVALVPLSCGLIFGYLDKYFSVSAIKNSLTQYGTGLTFRPITWVPDIVISLVCICILISLFKIFESRNMFILTTFIISLGFISRMVISFSPTIWASSTRTFIFMYFSIIVCSVILYQEIKKYKERFFVLFSNYIIFFSFVVSFFTNISR